MPVLSLEGYVLLVSKMIIIFLSESIQRFAKNDNQRKKIRWNTQPERSLSTADWGSECSGTGKSTSTL